MLAGGSATCQMELKGYPPPAFVGVPVVVSGYLSRKLGSG